MTTSEAPPPIHDRIKSVQKQLRTAIQNHQLLILKHRVSPSDGDVLNHINVIQGLIISMGRTQAELLAQFKREFSLEDMTPKNGRESPATMFGGSWPDAPKDIPIYQTKVPEEMSSVRIENKKIASWKSNKGIVTLETGSGKKSLKSLLRPVIPSGGLIIKKIPKVIGGNGTVKLPIAKPTTTGGTLLVKRVDGTPSGKIMLENNSEIKIININKINNGKKVKSNEESLLKPIRKKLQSVLKSKSPDKIASLKEELKLKLALNGLEVSTGVPTKKPRLEVDDSGEMEIIPLGPSTKATPSNALNLLNSTSSRIRSQQPHSSSSSSSSSSSGKTSSLQPQPPGTTRTVNNKAHLKTKKRLQSNLFVKSKMRLRTRSFLRNRNFDYENFSNERDNSSILNSCTEDLQPHWLTIEDCGQDSFLRYFGLVNREQCAAIKKKKGGRKRRSVAGQSNYYNDYLSPIMPKRTYSRKPQSSLLNSQVVVETALEVEDEDEKTVRICTICQKNGNLEVCDLCSEAYHLKCASNPSGGCPTCNAQHSNIKNIVGANSAGSASSMELIKRYLSSSSSSSPISIDKKVVEMKQNIEESLQWSVVITAKPKV